MQDGKPSASVAHRVSDSLRLLRKHWVLFALVAGLGIIAASLSSWQLSSKHIKRLQNRNAVLQERINALASSSPSQWRRLSDRTRGLLLAGLQHPDNNFTVLVVYATAEAESRQYAAQFIDAARLVGIETRPREAPLTDVSEVGLAVASSTTPPSEQAEKLKDILASAGLEVRFSAWSKSARDEAPVDFALFVGPKQWEAVR